MITDHRRFDLTIFRSRKAYSDTVLRLMTEAVWKGKNKVFEKAKPYNQFQTHFVCMSFRQKMILSLYFKPKYFPCNVRKLRIRENLGAKDWKILIWDGDITWLNWIKYCSALLAKSSWFYQHKPRGGSIGSAVYIKSKQESKKNHSKIVLQGRDFSLN